MMRCSFFDYDKPEDLLLDLSPEEIDLLYDETFNKKEEIRSFDSQ